MNRPLTEAELEDIVNNLSDISDNEAPLQNEFQESDSDFSDKTIESHETVSDTESEHDDEDDQLSGIDDDVAAYFYGKNRYKWSKSHPASSRTRAENIILQLPWLKGPAADNTPTTPYEAWSLLVTENILDIIVEYTNRKITDESHKYASTSTFVDHTDKVEIKALLGLLYLSGIFKSAHEDAENLWATDGTGRDIFRLTMSLKRFLFLLTVLRFDDPDTREARKAGGDKLAPISEIFQSFIGNCKSNYNSYRYVTVDEMLVGFRGKCGFRVYMKSKPQRYGLKIQCLCDSKTHYLLNAFVYTGKNPNVENPRHLSIPTLNVLELITPIAGSNRNVTGDNWFTSLELLEELKKHKLTYVGTIRRNKREIPKEFLANRQREVNSSIFGFTRDNTLVSYVPAKNRSVLLVSTLHHDKSTKNDHTKKPEIIEFYNSTKSGVDSLDQKCAVFSCSRRTRRWPLAIFYAILNIAVVNSHILLNFAVRNLKMSRKSFIKNLGLFLIEEHMRRRHANQHLPRELRQKIKVFLKIQDPVVERDEPPQKRRRCKECPSTIDKKHSTYCTTCNKTFCKLHLHQQNFCNECKDLNN